ncbi:MAG: ABC transporter permease subunit [Eubacteriales bacterium]|nr:ABC transporter permease subunit [Eubacteriales bacterium]
MKNDKSKFKNVIEKAGAVLFALLLWQLAAMIIDSSILIVTPVQTLKRLFTIWMEPGFFKTVCFTFSHIFLGYFIAICLGILLAFAAARLHLVETLLWPFVIAIRSVPVASMVVIFLIWVSARNLSVIISFLVVFPVVYNNILSGLKNVNHDMEEMASVFNLSPIRKLKYITLPQIRSYLLSAAGVTAGMAWKAGVAAEIIGTPPESVGKMIYQSKIWLDTDDLLAWTLILVILSVIFERVFTSILKGLLK